MFTTAVSQDTKRALAILGQSKLLTDAYLAGGTAAALHLGHRFSFDLDFFTHVEFPTKAIVAKLKELPGFQFTRTVKWTILGEFLGVKFSYFYYPYPLIGKASKLSNIAIASLEDIAAMKIVAIGDRGKKRDFIDLYVICHKKIPLTKVLRLYDKKYGKLANNFYHITKSLSFFSDAENDDMPQMIEKVSWEEVKAFFQEEVKRLSRKIFGLK